MGSNLAQDFIMGVDPFGVYTSQYGQQAEQAGLSEGQHRTKQLVSAAGGVIGGGAVLPSLVMGGVTGGQQALKAGKGRRLAAFGKGFLEGAKKPAKGIVSLYRAQGALGRATKGATKLTDKETAAFKNLMGEVQVKDVLGGSGEGLFDRAKKALRGARGARQLSKGVLTKDMATLLRDPLKQGGLMVGVPVLAGGAFGGGAAALQYSKGRDSEKQFRARGGDSMYKMSSVDQAAARAGFYSELEKIAGLKDLTIAKIIKAGPTGAARAAGRTVRKAKDAVKSVTGYPKKLYGAYADGFHERSMADRFKALGEDIGNIDPATLAVPALVGGTGVAVGAGLGLASRKRNNRNRGY